MLPDWRGHTPLVSGGVAANSSGKPRGTAVLHAAGALEGRAVNAGSTGTGAAGALCAGGGGSSGWGAAAVRGHGAWRC